MNRRDFLKLTGAASLLAGSQTLLATSDASGVLIAAAWRGPSPTDPYFAGVLVADWASKKIAIRHALQLPTRPHGLLPAADGSILVVGVRPATWMLRIDSDGKLVQQVNETGDLRFNGHAIVSPAGDLVYTTETDFATGRGRIGVRDAKTLQRLETWDSHGIEPHQLLVDRQGALMIANGGIPRTLADKKFNLQRMESSLVRLDGRSGKLLRRWQLDDPRLSLRHLAWSALPGDDDPLLGVAMQAEHDSPAQRNAAPVLAVLDGDTLLLPTGGNTAGAGYAGDIAASSGGGFALSNNQTGTARLWRPNDPEQLLPIVEMQEAYALADWAGPQPGGGILVSTAPGLIRWHPAAQPLFLPWPQPMALDNHWVVMREA